MSVEPVPGEPAAIADLDGDRALVVADYHAGIEAGLRRDGLEVPGRADERRESLVSVLNRERPDRLVVLGDLGHAIGEPPRDEREELLALFDALPDDLDVTVASGNHDGAIDDLLDRVTDRVGDVDLTAGHGVRLGSVGFAHGHTWPNPDVLAAETVCVAHEHPVVRLEDEVGGHRAERVWLRGQLVAEPFESYHERSIDGSGDLVVFPAFNDLSGGTWINVQGQEFLSPFLPGGLTGGEAHLLDGTRLGKYRQV